ncbi:MAG: NADH-quinone oxidoreductase subunit NuoN [Pseudomonadota bacterium]
MTDLYADLGAVLPEIVLALGAMLVLMIGVVQGGTKQGEEHAARSANVLCGALLIGAAFLVWRDDAGAREAFGGLLAIDAFAAFAKILILVGAAVMLALGVDYLKRHDLMKFEYAVLLTFSALGMCLMASANDLMTLYMGVELQSLSLYVIAAFRRDSIRSTEAGLKYFVLGALSSGLLLYGASLIYGYSGSTNFADIAKAVAVSETPIGLLIGIAFLCAGLAFKISAAPFHMWTPDVYEGAPAPVTAFFATAPKVAAGAMFARAMVEPFGAITDQWSQIIAFLAVCSMFLGAFAGIGQSNIKRLMAYSSISHMGFALVGLAAGTRAGIEGMLVYLAIYLLMNIGVFAFILMMTRDGAQVTRLADLDGLAKTRPGYALGVAALMFSLAGIPPLWGFFAKYQVFQAAVDADMAWLAVAGVIASVIGAFYYLNIVRRMYFSEPGEPVHLAGGFAHRAAFAIAAVAMVAAVAPAPGFNGFGAPEAAARAAEALMP